MGYFDYGMLTAAATWQRLATRALLTLSPTKIEAAW